VVWVEAGDLILEMQHLNQAWRSKGKMVGSGGNEGSNSSVGIPHKTIGNQSIRGIPKNVLDSMMARLVEHVRGRVIREVNHRLVWGQSQPPNGIIIMSWGPKACDQICPLAESCCHCVAWKMSHLWKDSIMADG